MIQNIGDSNFKMKCKETNQNDLFKIICPKKWKMLNTVESKRLNNLVWIGKVKRKWIIILIFYRLMSNTERTCKKDYKINLNY